jgi:hypothetical protein
VFSSDRDGDLDIYTMEVAPVAATGNQPLRLTDSPEVDSKPDRGPSLYGLYGLGGFYDPVDNLPATNGARAGSAVPVKGASRKGGFP